MAEPGSELSAGDRSRYAGPVAASLVPPVGLRLRRDRS